MLNPDRTPVRPLRGPYASLLAELQNLRDGEFSVATDDGRLLVALEDELGVNTFLAVGGRVNSLTGVGAVTIGGTVRDPEISIGLASAGQAGLMSTADKVKLDTVAPSANDFVLQPASLDTLGGVKADGTTTQIDPDGTIHAVGVGGGGGSITLVSGTGAIGVTNGATTPVISVATATTAAVGVVRLADGAALAAGTAGRVVDAEGLASLALVAATRQVIAGGGLSGGGALSGDVTLSLAIASQVEAEAGTDNAKAMTALRVAQATADLVPQSRQLTAGAGLTGGGDLTANRSLALDVASQAEAEAGTENTKALTSLRVAQAIAARVVDNLTSVSTTAPLSAAQGKVLNDNKVPTSRQVIAGSGLTGGGNLSANRTLALVYASQAEAEAGADNVKVMTSLRVAQAMVSRVPTSRQVIAGTGLTGGGDLTADRTFALSGQALLLHQLAGTGLVTRTAAGGIAVRSITGSGGISVSNGDGSAGSPVISPTVASSGQAAAGAANDVLMTPLRTAEAISALAATSTVELVTFTASGTFAKSSNDLAYVVEVIGGGASGAKSGNGDPAGGGGGGGRDQVFLLASAISSSVAVTVGAGGPAVTAVGGGAGNPGGSSSFGGYAMVYGGRGGSVTGDGGFGGGPLDPASLTEVAAPQGVLGALSGGFPSVHGGGAGNGGGSVYGGGGGGRSTGDGVTGGSSRYGGNGGSGGTSASGSAGQIPGGGGGATQTGTSSGAGARGEVRVYRIKKRP
jgi:hypothetical protein